MEYRLKNADAWRSYRNNYRTKDPRGIFDVIKQSAKRRGIAIELIQSEFSEWYIKQDRTCIYCGRNEVDILKDDDVIQTIAQRLTIDRKDNSKGYSIHNIGLCCRRCNTVKGNFFTAEEMKIIGQIIKNKYADK